MLEPIAVVGMAARFPAAADLAQFWRNIAEGRDCLTELTDEELLRAGELPRFLAHPGYVRRRPRLAEADAFDARCFGMTPREAEIRDPQQRVLLEVCHAALEHGGYDPARYPGAIGVFAGTNVNRYRVDHLEHDRDIRESVSVLVLDVSNAPDYAATFVAHRLGLRGPGMTVQTACSTALTALHTACLSLRAGDCDLALAGVASIEMPMNYGYLHIDGGIQAPDGTAKPFDAGADGTNFGDGAGAVLLKRLDRAVADGDTVYAVIRGSALNNDGGRATGFTAPSVDGQADCVTEAIVHSGVSARDISYVEAHGTGTVVGDPIEVAGLAKGFQRAAGDGELPAGYCWIGSVKGNVGHLGQAAGICGFIKTVLALWHGRIPPSIHVSRVNPALNLDETPFRVAVEPVPWPRVPGSPRRAGVSSFGIGGTNGHVVLEEAPEPGPARRPAPRPELVVWSGADRAAVEAQRERLADHFDGCEPDGFADAAHTMRVGRTARRHRAAVVAADAADAARRLRSGDGLIRPDEVRRGLVFCFPGQGAQHPGMGRDLYDREPEFRAHLDELFALARPLAGRDLRALWLAADDPAALAETAVAQPLLFAVGYALARTLRGWGLAPERVLGHSVGELVAATVAGVLDPADGLRAVVARAGLMQAMPRGAMCAVAGAADEVRGLLPADVSVAVVNDARQCVIAGPADAVATAVEKLAAGGLRGTPLKTSHAFHTPSMATAADQFAKVLADLPLHPPATPIVSCATGAEVSPEEATDPRFWAGQLTAPVDFAAGVRRLVAAGPAFLVEVGPGHTLTALLRGNAGVRAGSSTPLPTMPATGDRDRSATLERTLGRLWVGGVPLDLERLDAHRPARRVPVPGYPYQRRRFWIERPADHHPLRDNAMLVGDASGAAKDPDGPDNEVGSSVVAVDSPAVAADAGGPAGAADEPATGWSLAGVDWVRRLDGRPAAVERQVDGAPAVVVLPAHAGTAAAVRTAFQQAGYATVLATAAGPEDGRPIGTPLNPASDGDWDALLRAAQRSGPPAVVAYGGLLDAPDSVALSTVDEQLDRGYFAVLAAARAIARAQRRGLGPVTLLVLTRWAVDVSGAEPVNPASSMVAALARTIDLEHPAIRCVLLDAAPRTAPEPLSDALAGLDEPLLALRGTAAWAPVLRPVPRTGRTGWPRLRPRGVYLITGGLGGIGLATARALAGSGLGPRIALLGRSGAPPADAPPVSRGRGESARPGGAEIAAALAGLADAGAQTMVVPADVADPAAVRAAVRAVEDRFGPVNGVVHAAGVPGGGLLAQRGRADMERVLAAKVRGTLVLEECFADRPPLDFLLLYSSQASLTGLVGSADYAAANGFLNAYAQDRGRGARWTASVAWPGWHEVGMMAGSAAELDALVEPPGAAPAAGSAPAGPLEHVVRFDKDHDWELDEHRFDGVPLLPGTGSLALTLAGARSLGLFPAGTPLDLRDTVFVSPVNGAEPIDVAVAFTPVAGAFRFRVSSRRTGGAQPWAHHANGMVAAATDVPDAVDVAALRARFSDPVDLDRLADRIQFGPRWQTVNAIWSDGAERLVELSLPEQFHPDLDAWTEHPALLDRATIALLAVLYAADGKQYLPFLYRRLTSVAPLTPSLLVHGRAGREQKGVLVVDADFYDPATGRALLAVRGYTVREVRADEFARGLAPRPTTPTATAPPVTPSPSPDNPVTAGGLPLLTARDGAAAIRQILGGSCPPLVLVNPPGPAVPIPGMPWIGATASAAPVAQPPAQPAAHTAPGAPVSQPPARPAAGGTAVAGRPAGETGGDVVDVLRELWTEALGVDEIGLDDDFFELGGNSLVSVQLSARIRQRFGVDLGAAALFDAHTIRRLADELTRPGAR